MQEVALEDVEKLMEDGREAKEYEDRWAMFPHLPFSYLLLLPAAHLWPTVLDAPAACSNMHLGFAERQSPALTAHCADV